MEKFKHKILYVEDEDKIRQTMQKIFNMFFENFLVASDGSEGLEIFKKNPDISLIITDLEMPNLDGIEMIKEIRNINKDASVFITSAYPESRYSDVITELNIAKYFVKPTRFNELLDLVKAELKITS